MTETEQVPPPLAASRSQPWLTALVLSSAWTLFVCELVIGKQVTFMVGGSARAWLVLLGLFQLTLVLGYAYAWLFTCRPRPIMHLLLVMGCVGGWLMGWFQAPPDAGATPATQPLQATVWAYLAGPFWVILLCSTTVTVIQSRIPPARRPGLYAASNAGAFVGLLSYPLVIEPLLGLQSSRLLLTLAVALVAGGHALAVRGLPAVAATVAAGRSTAVASGTWLSILWWSFLGCAFLTVATEWATLDISSVPLLWALLLAAYLASWVAVMGPLAWVSNGRWDHFAGLSLLIAIAAPSHLLWSPLAMVLCVWLVCCALHARVAEVYPVCRHAQANVMIAVGGAIGGMSAAILPPLLIAGAWEWRLMLLLIMIGVIWQLRRQLPLLPSASQRRRRLLDSMPLLLGCAVAIFNHAYQRYDHGAVIYQARDFYTTWSVAVHEADAGEDYRLISGRTYHGSWGRDASWSYYGEQGPVGAVIQSLRARRQGPLRVLMVGLGAGTSLQHFHEHDEVVIAEISPALVAMHQGPQPIITSLIDSKAQLELILGDGRQVVFDQPPESFDLIMMDAFTSGAIPAHLLTAEALTQALKVLRPDGLLAVHTSNHLLRMSDVVMSVAQVLGVPAAILENADGEKMTASTWVAMGSEQALTHPRILILANSQIHLQDHRKWSPVKPFDNHGPLWTDDHSSLLPYLWW